MDTATFEHDSARAIASIKQTAELIKFPALSRESKDNYIEIINVRADELTKMLDHAYKRLRKTEEYIECCKMSLAYFEKNNMSDSIIATVLRKIFE